VELPSSAITRKFPARRVIACGLVLTGAGFGATGLVTSTAALAATVVMWTLGEIATAPVTSAYVADLSPPHMRGRYAGAFGMTFGLALVVGPAAGTALFGARPGSVWAACAGLGVIAALLILLPAARPRAHATSASRSTSAA
jgi:MFS family permease